MRFIDELLHPENKCQRVGHAVLRKTQSRWMVSCTKYDELVKPEFSFHIRCVGHQVEKIETCCLRCGVVVSTEWTERYSLQGISLPTAMMDEFNRKGMIEVF